MSGVQYGMYASVNDIESLESDHFTHHNDTSSGDIDEQINALARLRDLQLTEAFAASPPQPRHSVLDMSALEFCVELKKIKQAYAQKQQLINKLETSERDMVTNIQNVLKTIKEDIHVKAEEYDTIRNILAQRKHEFITSLELAKHRDELKEYKQYYDVLLPLLREIRDHFAENESHAWEAGICPICFEENAEYVVVPCGHVLCGTCRPQLHRECFVCRARLDQIIRLYL